MGYNMTWHPEYAAESICRHELNKFATDPDLEWVEFAIECGEVAQLAKSIGDEIGHRKVTAIAETVLAVIAADQAGGNRRTRSYRKITLPQRRMLAVALLERFGSARGVAARIWNLTDDAINAACV